MIIWKTGSERRNTYIFKFRTPNIESLKALSTELTMINRDELRRDYGKLSELLDKKINIKAFVTLDQLYDPPLRCFTFQDFQLAPTLEEVGRILGRPLKDLIPFTDVGKNQHLN